MFIITEKEKKNWRECPMCTQHFQWMAKIQLNVSLVEQRTRRKKITNTTRAAWIGRLMVTSWSHYRCLFARATSTSIWESKHRTHTHQRCMFLLAICWKCIQSTHIYYICLSQWNLSWVRKGNNCRVSYVRSLLWISVNFLAFVLPNPSICISNRARRIDATAILYFINNPYRPVIRRWTLAFQFDWVFLATARIALNFKGIDSDALYLLYVQMTLNLELLFNLFNGILCDLVWCWDFIW